MNRLFEREQRLHLSDKEADRLILKITRKFTWPQSGRGNGW